VGKIWAWAKWPFAIAILALLYWQNRDNLQDVFTRQKDWGLLGAALLLCLVSTLLTFARWYLLVRAQNFVFRLGDAIQLGFVGLLFNYVGPGAVGGDVAKAWMLAQKQGRLTVAVATVVLDRILGLLALFAVGAVATLLHPPLPNIPELRITTALLWIGTIAGLIGLGVLLTPAITHHRWVRAIEGWRFVGKPFGEMLHGVELYQSRRGVLLAALGLSLAGHLGLIGGFYLGACALQPVVPSLLTHFYFMPIAELFSVLIPTPGGIGALEGAIQRFYVSLMGGVLPVEAARAAGFVAAMAFRVVQLLIAAMGAVSFLFYRQEIRAAIAAAEAASHEPQPVPASQAASLPHSPS
jgi:uncharacterized protein (TIRG00374 family)